MYLDMFGGGHSPDGSYLVCVPSVFFGILLYFVVSSFIDLCILENTGKKKSDVELSELIFENKSDDESDNLSCCDGESNAVHTEDLIRRGVTRKIGKV